MITWCDLPSIVSNRLSRELRRDNESLSLGLLFSASRLLFAIAVADVDGRLPLSPTALTWAYGCSAGRTLSYGWCWRDRTRAYGELQSSAWLIELCCETLICFFAPDDAIKFKYTINKWILIRSHQSFWEKMHRLYHLRLCPCGLSPTLSPTVAYKSEFVSSWFGSEMGISGKLRCGTLSDLNCK